MISSSRSHDTTNILGVVRFMSSLKLAISEATNTSIYAGKGTSSRIYTVTFRLEKLPKSNAKPKGIRFVEERDRD